MEKIISANAFALSFLVKLISCNCKNYCKKPCSSQSNEQNCSDMCKCGEFCQNRETPLPRTALEKRSPTSRRTLLIFNNHLEIFRKVAAPKRFQNIKMSKCLRSLENCLKNSLLLLVQMLVLSTEAYFQRTCPPFKNIYISDVLVAL